MVTIKDNSKQDFCILNLTDPQLKSEEWDSDNKTGNIFKTTAETLIKRLSPGLITISGDLSYAGDFESYKNFADYFDSFKIPWTCCFGNHDNQDGYEPVKRVIDEYVGHKYFIYEPCDFQLGNGNFTVLIEKNGKAASGVILMDTHDRISYKSDECGKNLAWAGLTKKQLAWYGEQISQLKSIGCNDTVLITHIPINAYLSAANAAFKVNAPDKSKTLAESYGGDPWNEGYKDSYGVFHEPISAYPEDEGAFDLTSRLGSTKNIVCGHNHVNNWVVNYQGVRFIFATKTGIGSYFEPEINGGTVLSVNQSGVCDVRHEYVDISSLL